MKIVNVRLDQLISFGNVRRLQEDPDLPALARSLQENGQETEIRIYPAGDQYVIKHGHRRVAAAQLIGWDTVRAVVDKPPADEDQFVISQYNENEQRLGLSYLEKAQVYARLKDLGWSQRNIAQRCGVWETDVSLALATLRATPKLQKAVEEGRLAPSAVEPLLSQPADVQEALADAAIQAKTVRKVTALVKAHQSKNLVYKQRAAMNDIPEDADPLEELAAQELQEALEHMRLAEQTRIQHPELVRRIRPTVEELVRKAASLKQYLDGSTWDDTGDLL